MGVLDSLIYGYRTLLAAGSELPQRSKFNFIGATVADNPSMDRTDVTIPSGASTPTGTGIPHIVGGVYNAAASLIVDADVHASANIAASKLAAAGSAGQIQYNNAGAPGGVTGASWDGSFLTLPSTVKFGSIPSVLGTFRSANGFSLYERNSINTADQLILSTTATAGWLTISSSAYSMELGGGSYSVFNSTVATQFKQSGNVLLEVNASGVDFFQSGSSVGIRFAPTAGAVATTGDMRGRSGFTIYARNAGNSANYKLLDSNADGNMYVGAAAVGLIMGDSTTLYTVLDSASAGAGGVYTRVAGVNKVLVTSTEVRVSVPTIGDESNSSPYANDGYVTHAFAADANYTVPASQYKYRCLRFDTGSWTTGRTVTFPNPATDALAYCKWVFNNTSQTMTVSNGGGGTTRTLTTGQADWFLIANNNVYYMSGLANP